MLTIVFGNNPQNLKKEITGSMWKDKAFVGGIEPNNSYRDLLDRVNTCEKIVSFLNDSSNRLIVQQEANDCNAMLGTLNYEGPYGEGEKFTCHYQAGGQDFSTALSNLNQKIVDQEKLNPPKIYQKLLGFELKRKEE